MSEYQGEVVLDETMGLLPGWVSLTWYPAGRYESREFQAPVERVREVIRALAAEGMVWVHVFRARRRGMRSYWLGGGSRPTHSVADGGGETHCG